MCLIYNKPFFVHLTGNKGRDSRITNLLKKFELLDFAIYNWFEDIDNDAYKPVIIKTDNKNKDESQKKIFYIFTII